MVIKRPQKYFFKFFFARACLILTVNFNSDHCVRSKNLIRPENVIFAPPTRLSTIDLKVLLFKVARTS